MTRPQGEKAEVGRSVLDPVGNGYAGGQMPVIMIVDLLRPCTITRPRPMKQAQEFLLLGIDPTDWQPPLLIRGPSGGNMLKLAVPFHRIDVARDELFPQFARGKLGHL